MKKNLVLLLIGVVCLSSCDEKKTKAIENTPSSPVMSSQEDFNNVSKNRELSGKIAKGDTIAYKELKEIYFDSGHVMEFLKNSLIMANNFNYPQACYDTYYLLKNENVNDKNKMTNKLANYYLLRAYEMNIEEAKSNVKKRFETYQSIPKSNDYWLEINK